MLHVEFSELSDPGSVRDHNEDFVGHWLPCDPEDARAKGWLFALADGVGGEDHGEVASRLAVEKLLTGFRSASGNEPLPSTLQRLVHDANLAVYEAASGSSSMATTVLACALRYDRAVIAHVGDSRCYLIRQGRLIQCTKDHTVPAEQLRMGLIRSQDAARAATRNLLTRSVGSGMFVNVDLEEHQIYSDDVIVLCSDGLHNSLKEGDFTKVLRDGAPLEEAAHRLVDCAKQRDGTDNISVQIIRVLGVERVGMYRGRQYKIR